MIPVTTLVLREIGLTLFQVGLALAAYSLAVVLLEVPSGALSDLWGRRRTYSLGTLANIAAVVLLLAAPGVWAVVLASVLRGAGRAFATGSLDALAIDTLRREAPDYDLQLFFSRVGMAIPAGLAATSLAGGFLPELASLPVLSTLASWSPAAGFGVNLVAHAVLVGVAGVLAWTLFREEPAPAHQRVGLSQLVRQIGGSVSLGFRTRQLALLLLSAAAAGLVLLSVETFWQPRLNTIVAADNVRVFGVLGSAYFAVAVLGNALSPLLVKAVGGNRAVAVMIYRILTGGALALLATRVATIGFASAYLVFFFLFAAAEPTWSAMLNELVPDERRSTLISVGSLMTQLGGFAGSLVFGVVSQTFGIPTSWLAAAVVFALSASLFVPLARGDAVRRTATKLASSGGDAPDGAVAADSRP
jgi:MFS family permease